MLNVDVAIVGAGFSGAALAIELASRLPADARIALVDSRGGFGRGVAYGTTDPDHRLNVPASRMGLFADRPDDFVRWLEERGETAGANGLEHAFAPRARYGDYVAERLAEAERAAGPRLQRIADRAVAVTTDARGHRLMFAEAPPLRAARLALCLGNAPCGLPVPPAAIAFGVRDRIILDPWAAPGIADIDADEDVLLVGTGLTMVDQVMSLARRGHRGRMLAVSRRGLMPVAHSAPRPPPLEPALTPGESLTQLIRRMRVEVDAHAATGGDWQALLDGVRPMTQALWDGLDAGCRRRFLRHFAPYWSVMRHRTAPEVGARLSALRASGALEVVAGRVLGLDEVEGRIGARLRRRGRTRVEPVVVDRIVNCAGLDRAAIAACDPLVGSLVEAGLARPDPLGLGLDVDESCRLIRRDGGASRSAYALGPLTVGRFWEVIAVPDIRVQCRDVALAIAAEIAVRRRAVAAV